MPEIYKLLIFLTFLAVVLFGGARLYKFLNRKIMESEKGFTLFFYIILMFVAIGGLFFATIFSLIYVYAFLAGTTDQ